MKELSLQNCRLDGRYDVTALLGRGSYAEIYVARDVLASPNAPHSQVVIKALNVFMQNDLDADLERTLVENFQNEAIALDRVRHPNIISRLGHGTAKDLKGMVFHYLVLEYLSGGDLAKYCPKTGLPFERAFDYLEQLCAGLSHAHASGIIHRDIKPQNLLLTADRKTVKIADFGVARFSHSDSPITRVGTNMYAPPEHSPVFAGNETVAAEQLTSAADIYSLAKSAYVLVTGESPRRFSGAMISDLPDSVKQKHWAGEFLRVLQKATRNNPQERQQSVNDFWKELSRVKILAEAGAGESEVQIASQLHVVPQPSITDDFSPNAPLIPKFSTSRDLKYKDGRLEENPRFVVRVDDKAPIQPKAQTQLPVIEPGKPIIIPIPEKKTNNFLRRTLIFGILLVLFAGGLFATQSYLRNKQIFPDNINPFKKLPVGVVLIDLNLRPSPGMDNQPIGLVPKSSRVRIVNTTENWYEVDIVEFGRPKENQTDAEHGWVSRKFIDVQEQ